MAKRNVQIELGSKLSPHAILALKKMKQGVKEIGALAKKALNFGTYLAAGAAGAATTLGILTKQSIAAGDELDKMSKRTGLTAEFLEGLQHAAIMGGNSLEDMEKAVRKISQSAADANDGLLTYTRQFDALGVEIKDAKGELKPTEQLFLETADALSKMENNTLKVSIASKLFGRAGTRLLPMLQNGKKGLMAMLEESHKLGSVWTKETTGAAADATDAIARVEIIAKNLRDTMAVELIPHVTMAANKMRDWYLANKELINSKIVAWTHDLRDGIGAAYDKINEWSTNGEFTRWWETAKLGAAGVYLVVAKINEGLHKIEDTFARIGDSVDQNNPLAKLTNYVGITDVGNRQAKTKAGRLAAESTSAEALKFYNEQLGRTLKAGHDVDENYRQQGQADADRIMKEKDRAVQAYRAGQERALKENNIRLAHLGA